MSALPASRPVSPESIRRALAFVPSDDRDLWVRMGMAVKSELGEEGFAVWDEWSQSADNYNATDAKAVWRSFKGGSISIGTLLHEAKQRGYQINGDAGRIDPQEIERHRRERAEALAKEEAERERRQEEAADSAADILETATGDPATHPYVAKKGNLPLGKHVRRGEWPQRGWKDALLVPIFQPDSQVWSIEAISPDGEKDSLKDGRKAGGIYPIGRISGAARVLIGEGVATVAACAAATGLPAAAALARGNLKAAAATVRTLSPNAEIVFLADDDAKPDGRNPGLEAAQTAARAFNASVALPSLGRPADFWDVWSERGPEAVKHAIEAAKLVVERETLEPARHLEPTPAPTQQPKLAAPAPPQDGPKTFPAVWFSDAQMPEHTPAIVKGLIDQGALAVVYGESGSGKTFFTQDMMLHVACGLPWRGRKVQRGLVVYVAAEAGSAILKRFVAWRERRLGEAAPRIPLVILTRGPNLLDGIDVAALILQLRALGVAAGLPVAAVVFDTLSRSIPGGDENKPQDMTALVGVADEIRDELGAATVLVHHTGKDPTKGARGHSSLFAAADLVMAVGDGCATVEKVRDGMAGERFPFRLEVIELGTDDEGDPITTCVVAAEDSAPAPRRPDAGLSGVGRIALQALQEAVSEQGETLPETSTIPRGVRGVTLEQWRGRFRLRYGSDGDGGQRDGESVRKAFQRGREAVLKAGLAGISDPYAWAR